MNEEQGEQEKVVVDAEDVREVVRWWERMSEKDKREMSGPAFNLMRKLEKALGEALEADCRLPYGVPVVEHDYGSCAGRDAMSDNRTPDPEYRDDLREHLSIHPMFEPPDNRTPDPAVQFVNIDQETDAAEHWEQYAVQVVAEAIAEWLDPGTWVRDDNGEELGKRHQAAIAEHAVAKLREAGHIKNLRQVGWWDENDPQYLYKPSSSMPYYTDKKLRAVYVEEGEQW